MQKNEKSSITEKQKSCFIITPIGNDTDPIRRHVDGVIDAAIIPILKEFEYEARIPHRLSMPGSINKQIVQEIHDSDLVIANLTDKNPNVMYELALRHCLGTPAIMIAEKGTELPFDINNQRTIFYVNDAKGVMVLQEDLRKSIKGITDSEDYKSPIVSVLGEIKMEKKILETETAKGTDSDALGLILKRLDRIENDVRTTLKNDKFNDVRNMNTRTAFPVHNLLITPNVGNEIDMQTKLNELEKIVPQENWQLTKNGEGIILYGHFKDFRSLLAIAENLRKFLDESGLDIKLVRDDKF